MFAFGGTGYVRVICRNGSWVPTAPDAAPTYSVYVNGDTTAILTGNMTGPIDSKTGYYQVSLTLSGGNGFAAGQTARVLVEYEISSTGYAEEFLFTVV